MRTKKSRWTWIAILALVSALSFAQFDFGGGTQGGSSKPWESFKLDATKRITLDFKNANVDAVIAALTKRPASRSSRTLSLRAPSRLPAPNRPH